MSLLTQASLVITPNGVKEGTLYSVIPSDGSGDMSVVRATTATRVNSAGLVELVPYNLLTWSEQFGNTSVWGALDTTITANTTIAPNGTTTADTMVISSSTSRIYQATSTSKGTYTASIYVKSLSGTPTIQFRMVVDGNDITDSIPTTTDWVRHDYTFNANISVDYFIIRGESGTGSVAIWGAQLVEGTLPKDYQKTETRLNIPRLDYSNGTCPSILVEPQRTNLALYSSSFDNANWNKSSGTITANATTAPDGTTTADLFTANGVLGVHDFFQGFTGGSQTTASIYVKKNTAQYVYISLNYQSSGVNWATGIYNLDALTTATFQSGGVTNQVATISDEGNGWRRITLKVDTANTTLFCMYGVSDSMSPTLSSRGRVENSSSASFYAWGAQLEAGSYATSYIPTTSASVTRNADVISKTGISSLIGQTEGTLFVDAYITGKDSSNGSTLFATDKVSSGAIMTIIYTPSDALFFYVYDGSSFQCSLNGGSFNVGDRVKVACGYKNNDFVMYINGNLVATDTSGSVPATDTANINTSIYADNNGSFINATALWKTRLTNTQLAQLTTI